MENISTQDRPETTTPSLEELLTRMFVTGGNILKARVARRRALITDPFDAEIDKLHEVEVDAENEFEKLTEELTDLPHLFGDKILTILQSAEDDYEDFEDAVEKEFLKALDNLRDAGVLAECLADILYDEDNLRTDDDAEHRLTARLRDIVAVHSGNGNDIDPFLIAEVRECILQEDYHHLNSFFLQYEG
jgi:hypothetical protein